MLCVVVCRCRCSWCLFAERVPKRAPRRCAYVRNAVAVALHLPAQRAGIWCLLSSGSWACSFPPKTPADVTSGGDAKHRSTNESTVVVPRKLHRRMYTAVQSGCTLSPRKRLTTSLFALKHRSSAICIRSRSLAGLRYVHCSFSKTTSTFPSTDACRAGSRSRPDTAVLTDDFQYSHPRCLNPKFVASLAGATSQPNVSVPTRNQSIQLGSEHPAHP